jgi:hypothetical protein
MARRRSCVVLMIAGERSERCCLACGRLRRLADAHIVPRAFYPPRQDFRAYSVHGGRAPRRPKGVYDREILCPDCDGAIGRFDDYAAKILRPWPKRADLLRDEQGLIMKGQGTRYRGYWIRRPDVDLLQCFAASLLWRAGVTSRSEMRLDLPPDLLARSRRVFDSADRSAYFDLLLMRLPREQPVQFVARPVQTFEPGFEFYMNGLLLAS